MVLPFRNLNTFEPQQVIHQVKLWFSDRTQNQIAALGLEDCKRAPISVTTLVADIFGHDDVTFLGHVNDCHGMKLPAANNPIKRDQRTVEI